MKYVKSTLEVFIVSRKSPYTSEDKVKYVKLYLDRKLSYKEVNEQLGVSQKIFEYWVNLYRYHGTTGLMPKYLNSTYSREFKYDVVRRSLSSESIYHISVELIISESVIRKWIKDYNSHIELKSYEPERTIYMAESNRKTTLAERLEAVQYCLAKNKDYKATAKKYDISYRQIYTWVKKYEEKGEEGLVDGRGKAKADSQLTELERLERENCMLKKLLEEKEREADILKKYEEFLRSIK
jgi:transposase-like protein